MPFLGGVPSLRKIFYPLLDTQKCKHYSILSWSPWFNGERVGKVFVSIFQGLYGRSWTKIASMIDTRTALQVKNYAKQYFRQKVKNISYQTSILLTAVRQTDELSVDTYLYSVCDWFLLGFELSRLINDQSDQADLRRVIRHRRWISPIQSPASHLQVTEGLMTHGLHKSQQNFAIFLRLVFLQVSMFCVFNLHSTD